MIKKQKYAINTRFDLFYEIINNVTFYSSNLSYIYAINESAKDFRKSLANNIIKLSICEDNNKMFQICVVIPKNMSLDRKAQFMKNNSNKYLFSNISLDRYYTYSRTIYRQSRKASYIEIMQEELNELLYELKNTAKASIFFNIYRNKLLAIQCPAVRQIKGHCDVFLDNDSEGKALISIYYQTVIKSNSLNLTKEQIKKINLRSNNYFINNKGIDFIKVKGRIYDGELKNFNQDIIKTKEKELKNFINKIQNVNKRKYFVLFNKVKISL